MGVKFLQHMGGRRVYSCADCGTNFANVEVRRSMSFRATSGQAYLFSKVVNVVYSEPEVKQMMTGDHLVREALCKNCNKIVGWKYEFAYEKTQRYKEGMVVLERAYLLGSPGLAQDFAQDFARDLAEDFDED